MVTRRIAYMPLITYPDPAPDEAIAAAVTFAGSIACDLDVTVFALDTPPVSSPLGDLLLDIPELIETREKDSRARCRHLRSFILATAGTAIEAHCTIRQSDPNAMPDRAADEARHFDLVLLPWSKGDAVGEDLAATVVFGSGRPTILIPAGTGPAPLAHVAVAWDGSRVAARALADVLPLLAEGARLTVLTVQDDKPLTEPGSAGKLVSTLQRRGYEARAETTTLAGRTIAVALQNAALAAGAGLMAMGGFGHSRLRDFILGGATQGVFTDLRLPVLLSH